MSNFFDKLSNQIIGDNAYQTANNELFTAYIHNMTEQQCEYDIEVIRKLAASAQYFYRSTDPKVVNEGATVLSMLLDVAGEENLELIPIANSAFSSTGDFPNISLLKEKFPSVDFKINIYDEHHQIIREELNTVQEISHPLTDYQKALWDNLNSDHDIITAAPTSTGKTHLILQYLIDQLAKRGSAFAAIVVPTRALITEVANNIYSIAKSKGLENDIEICTIPKTGTFKEQTLFVMTQERLYELLQSGDLYFNYLFVDEAHNISDKSRGVLLHMTLQKLLEDSLNPQIIISMPSQQYRHAFSSVFDQIEFSEQTTGHSPVAKIFISVRPKGTNIELTRLNSDHRVTIPKNFKDKQLADIVLRLGKNESNIVYRNRKNDCESTAEKLAERLPQLDEQVLNEAADYITNFIHPNFTLAHALTKGVAFHYGSLPGNIRRIVEELMRSKHVKHIVCTSTLAEGVNLPAKNLFLVNPYQPTPKYQPNARLEDVKLENITGRAGRMLEHFSGNIFLFEDHEWTFQDYFNEPESPTDKIPTFYKILNEELKTIVATLAGTESEESDNQYTYYTIANKLLKEYERETLNSTLNVPELHLTQGQLITLTNAIENAYSNLNVAPFTLEANPTIGYLQQNNLYQILNEENNLESWSLPHPRSRKLYDSLCKVCELLSSIGIFKLKHSRSFEHLAVITCKWIQGDSMRKIIAEQIQYDEKNSDSQKTPSINKSTRTVIDIINDDVRFRLSNALRCYHLLLSDALAARAVDHPTVKLHSYIEIGGCDDRIINLIGIGVSRATAIEINELLPVAIEITTFSILKKLLNDKHLEQLHPISKKELNNLLN